jgi:hypothetical protein
VKTPARKAAVVAAALLGALLVGALGYGVWLVRWLRTPAFQQQLLQRVRSAAGTDVRVKRLDVSLLSGVTLEGIGVANPPPFRGDLLTADGLVLRYKLWPLVSGRFEVERLALERPLLNVAMDSRGTFNYERLGGPRSASSPGSAAAAAVPLRIVLSKLSVRGGAVAVTDATRARLLALDALRLDSAFEVAAGVATGKGQVGARTLDLGGRLFVRELSAPLALTKESFTLAPIRGRAGGGDVKGDAAVRFKNGFRYSAGFELTGASVKTLLEEARSPASVTGTLEARGRFEGTGGLVTLHGKGQGRISSCRVADNRSLALIATVLGIPELANPSLDECRAEFTQAGTRFTTPVLVLKGRALDLSGHGSLDLQTSGLDYDLTLALSPPLFAKLTRRELRPAFRTRADGFATIEFHLSGTTLEPKTDILARLGRGAAEGAVKGMLGRLFGKDKKKPD